VRAINLGSVSNPLTTDLRASYVVLDATAGGHTFAHRRVPYDHDEVIARIRRSGHPSADYLIAFQQG
jgi:diadenosine tetraphosphatase ApaH/serine/threonine PP2A family protein phosphatase